MPPRPRASSRSRTHPSAAAHTVTPRDLDTARLDALLQLRLGRTAHLFAVAVSGLLGLDAVLLLFAPQLPRLAASAVGLSAVGASFYLLVPLLAALSIGWATLLLKWREFSLWPWEAHFSTSVAGAAVGAVAAWIYLSRVAGLAPWARVDLFPWFYPLCLFAASLALIGIARTWSPWGSRQWLSATAAAVPLVTALWVYFPPSQLASASEPLATALLVSAILYQTSGSLLHLLSSDTEAHRKAVVLVGQDRIGRLAEEIGDREEALRRREAALLKRESEADVAQASARRDLDLALAAKQSYAATESESQERAKKVAEAERSLAARTVELEGRERMAAETEASARQRLEAHDRDSAQLDERAARLAQAEGELAQHRTELQQIQSEIERRARRLTEDERRVEQGRQQLEERSQELLRREGDVSARELAAQGRKEPSASERELGAREARSRQLKSQLDEQNALLIRRAQEAASQARAAEAALRQHADQMAQVAAREAVVSKKEADLLSRSRANDARRAELDRALAEYHTCLEGLTRRESELAGEKATLDEALRTVPKQQEALVRREEEVAQARAELERREAEVLARERVATDAQAELGLRRARLDASERALRPAGPPTAVATSAAGTSPKGSANLGVGSGPASRAPVADRLNAAHGHKDPNRLPTGTTRLDDLLRGGLPPRSCIALVGDTFVGKEVALYAFVAEGLRRSEAVVLVTATRAPEELAESLTLVLPQFPEHEQLGKVGWVDASGSTRTPRPGVVPAVGSDRLAATLSALVKALNASREQGGGAARVGVLGLSTLLAGAEERVGMAFLQNLVGTLKAREALAVFSLDAGTLPEGRVESILTLLDGAILFRQDRDRTFLSVRGLGEVETREWIECRATSRSLIVGSFALERIR